MTNDQPDVPVFSKIFAIVVITALLWLVSSTGYAYDFNVSARTEGYGYQLRRRIAGGVTFVNRRRLTQYLGLRVYNLLDPGQSPYAPGADDRPPALLYVHGLLRFDTDFGDYGEVRSEDNPELRNDQFELLLGAVEGRNLWGLVDFSLGRLFDAELLDIIAYDGLRVRVNTPWFVFVEASAGLQVDRSVPFSSAVFETDGTSGTAAHDEALTPVMGVSVGLETPSGIEVRGAYRVMTAKALPEGAAADELSGSRWDVDQEVAFAHVAVPIFESGPRLAAAMRYNLLLAQFDEITASANQQLDAHEFELSFARSRPHFDGDSIFNIFAIEPYTELLGRYSVTWAESWHGEISGGYRWLFDAEEETERKDSDAVTGSLVVAWERNATAIDGGVYYLGDRNEHRIGGDLGGRWLSPPWVLGKRFCLSGRASAVRLARTDADSLTTFGLQFGALVKLLPNVRFHLLLEDNINRHYASALRVLGILDMEFAP